jgi:hypothetical protein
MRSLALFSLLAGTAASAFAAKRVTVAQLGQEIIALKGKPDAKAARQLSDLELTERLSVTRFAELQTEIPGPKAGEALRIIWRVLVLPRRQRDAGRNYPTSSKAAGES